ncbi:MAG: hypothetical protein AAGF11_46440 [Myxococcota bacterium]
MRTLVCSRSFALVSLGLFGLAASSCALFSGAIAKSPTMEFRKWQRETVLVEPSQDVLGDPSVFVDAKGRPGVVLADRAFYVGMQSVAHGRRSEQGWQLGFPLTPSAWRVCGQAGPGGATIVTYGELEGPLTAVAWDGVTTTPAEPGPCPRPSATLREVTGPGGVHQLELSGDARTLWHRVPAGTPCGPHDAERGHRFGAFGLALDAEGRPQIAVFERDEHDESAAGRLRHATCRDGEWTSTVIVDDVRVAAVGLAVAGDGVPHVAYVVDETSGQRLVYAVPEGTGSTVPDRDARVLPAVEACLRAHATPPSGTGVEAYQQGDPFRCAVLERDPEPSLQALEVLEARCKAKEPAACAVAASLHHHLMGDVSIIMEWPQDGAARWSTLWRGLQPAGVSRAEGRAAVLYGQACELGDLRACLFAATLLPHDDMRRLPWATAACEAELTHGCALAVVQSGQKPKGALAQRAMGVLRGACDAGDMAACDGLGVMLHLRGDSAQARTLLTRACEAKLEPACTNLQSLPK